MDPTSAATGTTTTTTTNTAAMDTLPSVDSDYQTFLTMMTTQMQNQNPMNPTSGTDYVTQMAQFANVQGITQLNSSITSMLAMQGLTQGVSLIGKSVTYTDAAGRTATGAVSSVSMVGGQPQLVINNVNVKISQIQTVQASTRTGNAAAASNATGS